MSSIIDTLITDRVAGTFYNATDLNRIGEAVLYIAGLLRSHGVSVDLQARMDWTREDFPTETDMAAYLANLRALRDAYATLPTTPAPPSTMEGLTHTGANDIERLLADLAQIIDWMVGAFHYAGQFYSGERVEHARLRFVRRRTMGELGQYTMADLEALKMQEIAYGW